MSNPAIFILIMLGTPLFVLAWALTGIGSHRTRQQREHLPQHSREGRGVVGRGHRGEL